MFVANIVPGQGFQPFNILQKTTTVTNTGRAVTGSYTDSEQTMYGMLTNASQSEIDQWQQKGHPISHKIIEYSAQVKAKPTDILKLSDGREFYVQGMKNHCDMNVSVSYYVEERLDVKYE